MARPMCLRQAAEPKKPHDTGGWTLTLTARPNSGEVAWQAAKVRPPEFWVMENVGAAAPADLQ